MKSESDVAVGCSKPFSRNSFNRLASHVSCSAGLRNRRSEQFEQIPRNGSVKQIIYPQSLDHSAKSNSPIGRLRNSAGIRSLTAIGPKSLGRSSDSPSRFILHHRYLNLAQQHDGPLRTEPLLRHDPSSLSKLVFSHRLIRKRDQVIFRERFRI